MRYMCVVGVVCGEEEVCDVAWCWGAVWCFGGAGVGALI